MNKTISIAPVRKSIVVGASPQRAFEVFTTGIDRWWPKTHGIGMTAITKSVIEPFQGGRWYTAHADGTEVVIGHIRVWDPGKRFVVGWEISRGLEAGCAHRAGLRGRGAASARKVRGTRVDLEHRDFQRMGEEPGQKMRTGVDGGWPGILEFYAAEMDARESSHERIHRPQHSRQPLRALRARRTGGEGRALHAARPVVPGHAAHA